MLVNCSAYKNGQKLKDLSVDQISEAVKEPGVFIWVALKDPSADEILTMQHEFNLHPLAVEDAIHKTQRPKIEEYGDTLFAVLLAPKDEGDEVKWGKVCLFVGEKFVLSIRENIERGFTEVRDRCEREPHLLRIGAGFVFYAIIDHVVDRFFPIIVSLESQLENIEDDIFKMSDSQKQIEAIYSLKAKAMSIKHTLKPLLDALDKLHGGRVPKVCADLQEYYRDVYDHLFRLEQSVEAVREMVVMAVQVNLALISLNETKVSKKLAAWAALCAVPTMIAGIYGMNFKHMPELEAQWGYPITLVVMLLIDLSLAYRFKKAGWI